MIERTLSDTDYFHGYNDKNVEGRMQDAGRHEGNKPDSDWTVQSFLYIIISVFGDRAEKTISVNFHQSVKVQYIFIPQRR